MLYAHCGLWNQQIKDEHRGTECESPFMCNMTCIYSLSCLNHEQCSSELTEQKDMHVQNIMNGIGYAQSWSNLSFDRIFLFVMFQA